MSDAAKDGNWLDFSSLEPLERQALKKWLALRHEIAAGPPYLCHRCRRAGSQGFRVEDNGLVGPELVCEDMDACDYRWSSHVRLPKWARDYLADHPYPPDSAT